MPRKQKDNAANDNQTPESEDTGVLSSPEDESANGDAKEDKKEGYGELAAQIAKEYDIASRFMKPKRKKIETRLKLYNNQKRDDAAVGDPLLFTTFNTVFAALYDDRLQQEWQGAEEGDDEVAEALNVLSEKEYSVMEMPVVSREWMWNALFVGRALVDVSEYDRPGSGTTQPIPIDPMALFRDPKATSLNGFKGRGAARFYGYEIGLTTNDIDKLGDSFFNRDKIKPCSARTDVSESEEARRAAEGYDHQQRGSNEVDGENAMYFFNVWFTWDDGKRVRVWTDVTNKIVHRYWVLPKQEKWPAVEMTPYPVPNSWDGVSIPDLIEDKQRHRAAVINQSLRSVKFSQNPAYLFDVNTVNKNEIAKTEFGNLIPVDGAPDGKVTLLPRDFVKSDVSWILDVLDGAAQRATATPETQQGVTTNKQRTLGELSLMSSKVDTRYSLTAKIFSQSFFEFWMWWYWNHKEFMSDLDKKVVRVNGTNGAIWRTLTKDNITAMVDPDLTIESKAITESKRFNELNTFQAFHNNAVKDPGYNIRAGLKKMAKLNGLGTDEINALFRKTTDEIEAEFENLILAKNKLKDETGEAMLRITQDHDTHIEIHSKAADTPAKQAHVDAHKKAKLMIRDNQSAAALVNGSMMGQQAADNPEDAAFAANSKADAQSAVTPVNRPNA